MLAKSFSLVLYLRLFGVRHKERRCVLASDGKKCASICRGIRKCAKDMHDVLVFPLKGEKRRVRDLTKTGSARDCNLGWQDNIGWPVLFLVASGFALERLANHFHQGSWKELVANLEY